MKIGEDLIVTPTLLRRFAAEAVMDGGDGRHCGIIRRDDGGLLTHHHPGSPRLAPEQMFWAADVLRCLNIELHHDGAWVVVFTHPKPPQVDHIIIDAKHAEYARYALIWLDQDGDPHFTMEWEEGTGELRDFTDVMLAGINSTLAKAEAAWELWRIQRRDVIDPRPDQLYKRAQGQRAPSATRH